LIDWVSAWHAVKIT